MKPARWKAPAGLFNLPIAAAAAMVLIAWAGSAEAATLSSTPGFWSGLGDGFLALLKLLISPFYEVALVDTNAEARLYDAGYYVGVLMFAACAGFAASPSQPEVPEVVGHGAETRVGRPVVG